MDTDSAIRFLEARGFTVSRLPDEVRFTCEHGHRHKTAEARDECITRSSRKTGLTLEELAAKKNADARPRYIAAYRLWVEVNNYRKVGEAFGVTAGRAGNMVRRGWRYCLKDGSASKSP